MLHEREIIPDILGGPFIRGTELEGEAEGGAVVWGCGPGGPGGGNHEENNLSGELGREYGAVVSTLYDLGEVEEKATLECCWVDGFEWGTANELFAGGGEGLGEGLGEDLQVGRDRDGFLLRVSARFGE